MLSTYIIFLVENIKRFLQTRKIDFVFTIDIFVGNYILGYFHRSREKNWHILLQLFCICMIPSNWIRQSFFKIFLKKCNYNKSMVSYVVFNIVFDTHFHMPQSSLPENDHGQRIEISMRSIDSSQRKCSTNTVNRYQEK